MEANEFIEAWKEFKEKETKKEKQLLTQLIYKFRDD